MRSYLQTNLPIKIAKEPQQMSLSSYTPIFSNRQVQKCKRKRQFLFIPNYLQLDKSI